MKKNRSLQIAIAVLGLASIASLAGSISGTIAWYAYTTRALVSYNGTSVSSTTQLQIGLKSDVEVTFPQSVRDLVQDITFDDDVFLDEENNEKPYHYYFMKAGSGGMPAAVINAYLSTKGYTTNVLEPLSSYEYHTGGVFDLRNRPSTNKIDEYYEPAEITKYVEIPFAFRVLSNDSTATSTYAANQKVFLSNAEAKAASENDGSKINESLRLYIDRDSSLGSNYILNPSKSENGKTKVCGVLDISNDGYYDYDNKVGSSTFGQEFFYGEYGLPDGCSLSDCLRNALAETSEIVDVNGSGITDRQTTFTARHYKGIRYYEDFEQNEQGTKQKYIIPKYAEYLGTRTVYPTKNVSTGDWEGSYAVCKTPDDAHKIGTFNMKVYLEGWDFSVIDDELEHEFYLGLTFEINIVK